MTLRPPALPRGSLPALVTPMRPDGGIDLEAFRDLLDRQAENGSSGVVVAGSTGEGAALSGEERIQLIAAAVERVGARLAVIAGCTASVTRRSRRTRPGLTPSSRPPPPIVDRRRRGSICTSAALQTPWTRR